MCQSLISLAFCLCNSHLAVKGVECSCKQLENFSLKKVLPLEQYD